MRLKTPSQLGLQIAQDLHYAKNSANQNRCLESEIIWIKLNLCQGSLIGLKLQAVLIKRQIGEMSTVISKMKTNQRSVCGLLLMKMKWKWKWKNCFCFWFPLTVHRKYFPDWPHVPRGTEVWWFVIVKYKYQIRIVLRWKAIGFKHLFVSTQVILYWQSHFSLWWDSFSVAKWNFHV